jgi:Fe-S-cluster-containing hydrogenase component 2
MHGEFNPSRSAVRVSKREDRGIYVPVISPFGGLLLDPGGRPIICDFCGGSPRCVEICPNDAIKMESGEG